MTVAATIRPAAGLARPRVAIAIGEARIAMAVEELLVAEERFDVRRVRAATDGAVAALVIADAPFLERSTRPLVPPAVVILREGADREKLAARVPAARAWLRTSSTGDELLAAVDEAIGSIAAEADVPRASPVALTAEPAVEDGPLAPPAPLGRIQQVALSALAALLLAAIVAVVWVALR